MDPAHRLRRTGTLKPLPFMSALPPPNGGPEELSPHHQVLGLIVQGLHAFNRGIRRYSFEWRALPVN
jgi:hypothetical protein